MKQQRLQQRWNNEKRKQHQNKCGAADNKFQKVQLGTGITYDGGWDWCTARGGTVQVVHWVRYNSSVDLAGLAEKSSSLPAGGTGGSSRLKYRSGATRPRGIGFIVFDLNLRQFHGDWLHCTLPTGTQICQNEKPNFTAFDQFSFFLLDSYFFNRYLLINHRRLKACSRRVQQDPSMN